MDAQAVRTIAVALAGPVTPGERARICALAEQQRAEIALCDVGGLRADAITVEALGRLQLAAGRQGCRIRLVNPSPALLELIDFMGLASTLPSA